MKLWQKLFLFTAAVIPFLAYLFRPGMIGADTYWYINQACGITPHVVNDLLWDLFNLAMPCDLGLMKLFGAMLFICTVFTYAKIGELYDKDRGWWLGLIAIAFSFFITEFFMYQNEPIAHYLFSIVLYCLIRYSIGKQISYLCIAVGLWVISGLFWKGVIYWGLILIVYAPITALVVIPAIIYYWGSFWWFLNADSGIAFYTPLIGIVFLGLTTLFLFGLLKSDKKQMLAWCFSIPFVVFVQRMYVIAIPMAFIITFNALRALKTPVQTIEYTLIVFCLFMSLFWGMHIYKEFPTPGDLELLQNLRQKTDTVQNSFGPGYLLINNGFNVSSYGWPRYPDYNHIGYVVIEKGIQDNNCPIDSNSDNLIVLKC